MQLPTAFIQQMQDLLGSDYADFQMALQDATPTSIRRNAVKTRQDFALENVAWHPEGYYLAERPSFTLDPSFHAGTYYVQEASSMFVAEAIKQLVDLNQPLKVLDLCAAPGGKSTLLLSLLKDKSFLLSNEVIRSRYHILQENLAKWGRSNIAVSNYDPKDFEGLEDFFDVVLVDAPCSGEGLFRKDPKAMKEWSVEAVEHCAARQKRILATAQSLVKEGGILLYCTCTYNKKENDENVQWLTENAPLVSEKLELPNDWKITERQDKSCYFYQFFPHLTKGEGFFLSCLRKTDSKKASKKRKIKPKNSFEKVSKSALPLIQTFVSSHENYDFLQDKLGNIHAVPKILKEDFMTLASILHRINIGTGVGVLKGKSLVPATALAMSTIVNTTFPTVELNRKQALHYLKKLPFEYEATAEGWHRMTYEGNGLGWAKILKNRMNNYYPKNWRIRMEIH